MNYNGKREQEEDFVNYILPSINPNIYIEFLDSFIFGNDRRPSIFNPIPPSAGQIKFLVRRYKSGLNKLSPIFQLMIEKIDGGTILVLYAKKIAFKQTSYYLISLEKNSKQNRGNMVFKDQNLCIGKLRQIDRLKYILYDNGESYSN